MSIMNLDLGKVLADAPNVNIKAYGNALLGYLEGFLRVSKPLSYPWKLDLILTKACNLRCTFCISYGSLKGERWMEFGLYEEHCPSIIPFGPYGIFLFRWRTPALSPSPGGIKTGAKIPYHDRNGQQWHPVGSGCGPVAGA